MSDLEQGCLFSDEDMEKSWEKEWKEMPEYRHKNLTPCKQVIVNFEKPEDYDKFKEIVEQKNMTMKTQSIWYPEAKILNVIGVKRYTDDGEEQEIDLHINPGGDLPEMPERLGNEEEL